MKEIIITETTTGFELESKGMNEFELLGILRYFERKIGMNMLSIQMNEKPKKRLLLTDLIKLVTNRRLSKALEDYISEHGSVYADEIQKHKFLRIRNVSTGSWNEFQELLFNTTKPLT